MNKFIAPQQVRSVLVYTGMELLGDGVMKIPFIRALGTTFPQAHITWMTGHGPTSLKSVLYPAVQDYLNEIIEQTYLGYYWPQFFEFPQEWRARHYDLIIDTQAKKWRTLILRKIPHRYFVSRSWGWFFSDFKPPEGYKRPPHLVDRLIDLITFVVGQPPTVDKHIEIPPLYQEQALKLLPKDEAYLGLSPGAGQDKKCWPLDKYIEVGSYFSAQGLQPVFILGPREQDWQKKIIAHIPLAKFPLQETTETSPFLTMALAQRCTAILANDSGVGHLLAVGETPILHLFGPTSAERYAPQTPYGRVLTAQQFADKRNIAAIPVAAVINALSSMIEPP